MLEETTSKNHLYDADWIAHVKGMHKNAFLWEDMDKPPLALMIGKRDSMDGQQVMTDYRKQFQDYRVLFEHELENVADTLKVRSEILPLMYVNYGESLIPSLFGAQIKVPLDDQPPWVAPCINDINMVKDMEPAGMQKGLMPLTIKALKYFQKCAPSGVHIYPPGILSPMDIAYLLRGSDLYTDMYDTPKLVHKLLEILSDTIISAITYIKNKTGVFQDKPNGVYVPGLFLGDDTCVNVSPSMLEEFDIPYLKKITNAFDCKLCVHFCSNHATPYNDIIPVFSHHEEIFGISTQMGLKYYCEHFEELKETNTAIHTGYCGSFQEAYKNVSFKEWAVKFIERFRKKWRSGLILNAYVPTVNEAAEIWNIWRKL